MTGRVCDDWLVRVTCRDTTHPSATTPKSSTFSPTSPSPSHFTFTCNILQYHEFVRIDSQKGVDVYKMKNIASSNWRYTVYVYNILYTKCTNSLRVLRWWLRQQWSLLHLAHHCYYLPLLNQSDGPLLWLLDGPWTVHTLQVWPHKFHQVPRSMKVWKEVQTHFWPHHLHSPVFTSQGSKEQNNCQWGYFTGKKHATAKLVYHQIIWLRLTMLQYQQECKLLTLSSLSEKYIQRGCGLRRVNVV